MAKKKEEEVISTDDAIGRLSAAICKEYGPNILTDARHIIETEEDVIPVSPYLDIGLGGGIPKGTWVSVCGKPKRGKTSTLLSFAASAQKHGIKHVFFANVEQRLKKKNLCGIEGLNTDPSCFHIIESTKDHILSAQDYLKILSDVLRQVPECLVIIDSVSSLVMAEILEGGIGTTSRGGGAKLMSQFIDLVQGVVPLQKSIVCGITHLISDTSGKTQGPVEKSGVRWQYQADIKLKVTWAEPWLTGGEGGHKIGQVIKWIVEESALGGNGMKCDAYLRYGMGIDHAYEIMEMAKAASLIETKGAWHTLSYLESHLDLLGVSKWDEEVIRKVKAQGAERCYKLLKENPAWLDVLRDEVMGFMGLSGRNQAREAQS